MKGAQGPLPESHQIHYACQGHAGVGTLCVGNGARHLLTAWIP